jgi:peptidoglycan-associated lipoprotein
MSNALPHRDNAAAQEGRRMRIPLLVVMPLVLMPLVACSTLDPSRHPSAAAVSEPSDVDLGGRWTGNWTGTGLFPSALREDAITLDFEQRGDVGHGRLVVEGAIAAESVPVEIRRAGQWGTRVFARISGHTVTLRHHVDGRLFTADLKVSDSGDRMLGFIRGSWPQVGMVLTREPRKAPDAPPVPQQAAVVAPAPEPAREEPAPQAIAMAPEPKPAEDTARPQQAELMAVQELPAIHFDYDKAELRPDALDQLQGHIAWLKEHADAAVQVAGHCDERGTAEYNLALGDRRAKSVRDHFSAHGIAPDRVSTVSHGKELPACAANTAQCHAMNRRAEFRVREP